MLLVRDLRTTSVGGPLSKTEQQEGTAGRNSYPPLLSPQRMVPCPRHGRHGSIRPGSRPKAPPQPKPPQKHRQAPPWRRCSRHVHRALFTSARSIAISIILHTETLPRQTIPTGPGKFPFAALCSLTKSARSCTQLIQSRTSVHYANRNDYLLASFIRILGIYANYCCLAPSESDGYALDILPWRSRSSGKLHANL